MRNLQAALLGFVVFCIGYAQETLVFDSGEFECVVQ